ncbi:MAG TPA: hypothetical protein VK675_00700 [Candidatus Paceibacterota bacterium]|nr:hypothetical protein [Candidatus Paceibacterota bacterium]
MNFVQVCSAQNEMEAFIIKGNLESVGIKSIISPINNNSPLNGSWLTAQDIPFGVYVEKEKVEAVKKFLEEGK